MESATAAANFTGTPFPIILNLSVSDISGDNAYPSGTDCSRKASLTVSRRGSAGCR